MGKSQNRKVKKIYLSINGFHHTTKMRQEGTGPTNSKRISIRRTGFREDEKCSELLVFVDDRVAFVIIMLIGIGEPAAHGLGRDRCWSLLLER